eukprot:COSAG05_NODE_11607_length_505_cov_1.174877_2_plen_40_part_01
MHVLCCAVLCCAVVLGERGAPKGGVYVLLGHVQVEVAHQR